MQYRFACSNVASVIWYMPTALEAGRYHSKGFHVRRKRQCARATGLPAPSTWASAARSSGVMTAVECPRKSDPYWRQVSGGVFQSAPLTGKNSSVGLRSTWYVQLTADHTNRITTASTRTRSASGRANSTHHARRPNRKNDRKDANRVRRARVRRAGALPARDGDVTTISATTARRASYSPRISRSRRLRAVIRSFIFSERAVALLRFFGGVGRTTVGVVA